jgi:hypothetical protein
MLRFIQQRESLSTSSEALKLHCFRPRASHGREPMPHPRDHCSVSLDSSLANWPETGRKTRSLLWNIEARHLPLLTRLRRPNQQMQTIGGSGLHGHFTIVINRSDTLIKNSVAELGSHVATTTRGGEESRQDIQASMVQCHRLLRSLFAKSHRTTIIHRERYQSGQTVLRHTGQACNES